MYHATRRGLATSTCLRTFGFPVPRHNFLITRQRTPFHHVPLYTAQNNGLHSVAGLEKPVAAVAVQSNPDVDHGEERPFVTRFADLSTHNMVCKTVVRTLTNSMGLETMTPVQSQTINETLKGGDVIAQARTGTGKTLAFLIPVLQNIIANDPQLETLDPSRSRRRYQDPDIRAIIVSPTRELAEQIAVEARKLVRSTGVVVQTAVGGSAKRAGLAKIMNDGCHILVGTPGRLNDILSDSREGVRAPKLSAFVLDEADRLLDAGFAPEIRQIESLLPDKRQPGSDRQTLMFSATVPKEVVQIVNSFMKRDYTFVRTIQPGEQETHERVPQRIVRLEGLENFLPALLELCKQGIDQSDPNMPFKAMVFFNATAEVMLAAATFQGLRKSGTSRNPLGDLPLIEIHARLTQMERTRASDTFRRARSAIMFTSDVTARGMDFPNVTHVIQVGLPPTKDTYIHRLGRTARGDKKGEGWLLSPKLEGSEARYRLKGLPLKSDSSLATAAVDMTQDAQIPASVAENLSQIIESSRRLPERLKHAAYISSIGSYTWISQKQQLIDAMNTRSKFAWGLDEPPMVSSSWARKLGLNGLKGLKLGERDDQALHHPGAVFRHRGTDFLEIGVEEDMKVVEDFLATIKEEMERGLEEVGTGMKEVIEGAPEKIGVGMEGTIEGPSEEKKRTLEGIDVRPGEPGTRLEHHTPKTLDLI